MIITKQDNQYSSKDALMSGNHIASEEIMMDCRETTTTRRARGHQRAASCPVELLRTSKPKTSSLRRSESDVTDGRKRVSFGRIEIRDYPMILGDHPDCTNGPPLTLGWEYAKTAEETVDAYERSKSTPAAPVLSLNDSYRFDLLRRAGFSHADLMETTIRIQKMQRQRNRTVAMMPLSRVGEAFSSGPFSFRKRKGNKKRRGFA